MRWHLHSNMVIFIIYNKIYLKDKNIDLHSNMVIFIMNMSMLDMALNTAFTFQYGYIYYAKQSWTT